MEYNLRIEKFRRLENLHLDFPIGLNWLSWPHGAGKSSVLSAMQLALFDRAFGAEHNQAGAEFEHHIEFGNEIFEIVQGRNADKGKYFYGQIGDKILQGEYAENHERFLQYFGLTKNTAFETLISRILFYGYTPTLWQKSPRELVGWLSMILGDDTERIEKKLKNTRTYYSDLKEKLDILEDQAKLLSGIEVSSSDEIIEQLKEKRVLVAGTLKPCENEHNKRVLLEKEQELKTIDSNHLVYCRRTKEMIAELKLKLTDENFNEVEVRAQRDELIEQLYALQTKIKQASIQIVNPLTCPVCSSSLLFEDNKLVQADTRAIDSAKETVIKLERNLSEVKIRKEQTESVLALVEIKRRLESLQEDFKQKEEEHKVRKFALQEHINKLKPLIEKSDKVKHVWEEIDALEMAERDIAYNKKRYEKFVELSGKIEPLKKEVINYGFFVSPDGFVKFRNQEFLKQAGQYANIVNEILAQLSLGRIDFEPVLDKDDGTVAGIKVFHYDPKKMDWLEYDRREGSMRVILKFCAFLAQRGLNPQPVDELQLIMIDDMPGVYHSERLAPLLEYIKQLPLVTIMAWSLDISNLIKPTQTIALEKSL